MTVATRGGRQTAGLIPDRCGSPAGCQVLTSLLAALPAAGQVGDERSEVKDDCPQQCVMKYPQKLLLKLL